MTRQPGPQPFQIGDKVRHGGSIRIVKDVKISRPFRHRWMVQFEDDPPNTWWFTQFLKVAKDAKDSSI